MGSLSRIKWQYKHERGSVGAGCVGFSGSGLANTKRLGIKTSLRDNIKQGGGGKSARQILRMKTVPKLKKAIGDAVAGEAFYKELRALVGRQDAKMKQERSEAASM
jgi:hypothetical protein